MNWIPPSADDLALLDPDGEFLGRLADDLEKLRLFRNAPLAPGARRLVHGLAGAASTFGYDEVGRLAIALDDRLMAGEPLLPPDLVPLISSLESAVRKKSA